MSAPFGQHCYDAPQGYYTAAPRHISSTGLPVMITPNIPIRPNYCQPHYGPNTRSSLISFPFHGNSKLIETK